MNIVSVDPPGCTDIDDALHCIELKNGNYEVGVHIADVSYFIKPGTALDLEAANRGNTVYLIDQRIDMVPELLSSNLCSLRGGQERFAFSVIWELDENAKVISVNFTKSIIKSRVCNSKHIFFLKGYLSTFYAGCPHLCRSSDENR